MSQASFNQARGITATNPYPDSFFSQLFGPENVNYAALGIDTQGIANLAYDRYLNPLTSEGTLREGLSEGERTVLGNVVEIDRPQGVGETIARTAFGLASPLGPLMSFMGKDQLAIAPNLQGSKGVNYDPKLDPNSIEYQGPQGFLGQFGKGIESITFGQRYSPKPLKLGWMLLQFMGKFVSNKVIQPSLVLVITILNAEPL